MWPRSAVLWLVDKLSSTECLKVSNRILDTNTDINTTANTNTLSAMCLCNSGSLQQSSLMFNSTVSSDETRWSCSTSEESERWGLLMLWTILRHSKRYSDDSEYEIAGVAWLGDIASQWGTATTSLVQSAPPWAASYWWPNLHLYCAFSKKCSFTLSTFL